MRKHVSPDEVGYGRPPKRTRFVPGISGNPRGRPKGSADYPTLLRRFLGCALTLIRDGERRKIVKLKATVIRRLHRCLKPRRATIKRRAP